MFRVASDGIQDTVYWQGSEYDDEGLFVVESGFASFVVQMSKNQFEDLKDLIQKFIGKKTPEVCEMRSYGRATEKDLEFMIVPQNDGVMINILEGGTRLRFFIDGTDIPNLLRLM